MSDSIKMPSGTTIRRKIKKVKRPIKRPINGNQTVPATPKISETPFNSQNFGNHPTSENNFLQQPQAPEKVDAFSLDAFLDGDNLPSIQTSPNTNQNNFEQQDIRVRSSELEPEVWKNRLVVGELYTGYAVCIVAVVFLVFGILFSKVFLSSSTVSQSGLQGVVVNSEVPRGRARCGVAEKTQGCVLYIMNPQRQDLNGRDFFDLAAQLTGRQRFMIETGNMRYSSIRIRPGDIAQLNIPPLQ